MYLEVYEVLDDFPPLVILVHSHIQHLKQSTAKEMEAQTRVPADFGVVQNSRLGGVGLVAQHPLALEELQLDAPRRDHHRERPPLGKSIIFQTKHNRENTMSTNTSNASLCNH